MASLARRRAPAGVEPQAVKCIVAESMIAEQDRDVGLLDGPFAQGLPRHADLVSEIATAGKRTSKSCGSCGPIAQK